MVEKILWTNGFLLYWHTTEIMKLFLTANTSQFAIKNIIIFRINFDFEIERMKVSPPIPKLQNDLPISGYNFTKSFSLSAT